ncbi:MAG: histidine kinase dimerization/phospho-acceptor domain-containing protein, partial [Pirellulales bacterium]
MKLSQLGILLPAATLALCTALGLAWLVDWQATHLTAGMRCGLLLTCLAIAGGCWGLAARRSKQGEEAIRRSFEMLCRLNHRDLADESLNQNLPSLDSSNPWHDVFERVRECLGDYARRYQQAEHARAAAEVRAQRGIQRYEHLEGVLAELPEPVVAVDEYENIVVANASAQELFDFECQPTEQRALAELVHCEKLIDMLLDARRRKAPTTRTCELKLGSEESSARWYSLTARGLTFGGSTPRDDSQTAPHGAVAVLRDISALKVIQKRNAEFVSAVSHEMKTPLSGIKAYVELLADGDAEDEATREEFLEVINSQADRMQRLIDNLLNLARIEAGVVAVNKKAQSLNDLLEEALGVVQPAAEQKGIRLTRELSPMYLGVLVDRDLALQAAINLLSNAIKYTPENGSVTLRSQMQEHHVRYEVEDTGVGLSPEDCEKVIEKFYRVKKHQQKAPGTGLGLPLAK